MLLFQVLMQVFLQNDLFHYLLFQLLLDFDIPFLGVHVTPSIDGVTYLGPTAIPAMGRENYKGMKGADPMLILNFIRHMAAQVARDRKMRNYIKEQAFDWTPKFFLNAYYKACSIRTWL